MIEETVLQYLLSKGITAFMEEPPELPAATFCLVQKTGSGKENLVCRATMAVQSYAPTLREAAELNEAVKSAMEELPALDSVAACGLNSDYAYMDTAAKRPRYQAVFDITHY